MTITPSEFEQSMENVTFPLAVAVSGGPDSLALLLLAHELAQTKGSHVIALTVDHGLRQASKEEAARVAQWTQMRGIQHVILDWVGDKPTARLQERARKARYALLTQWCHRNQISTLLLGHHQQDQEETFWLRLSSGSGLTGLSGMKKRNVRDGIVFLRPLLDVPKERLKATLEAHNQEWITDPSNQSSRFFRGRMRHFLSEEGLSSSRLDQVIKKLQMDADFIQDALETAITHMVQAHEGGYLTIKRAAFNEVHPAITKRLLAFLMQWFSNADYAPRTTQITGVMDKMKRGVPFTAGGIYWVFADDEIVLFRESRAVKEGVEIGSLQEKTLWDQRFWIDPQLKEYVPEGTVVGALIPAVVIPAKAGTQDVSYIGLPGSRTLRKSNPGLNPGIRFSKFRDDDGGEASVFQFQGPSEYWLLNTDHWKALPALWLKGKVVAVPHLCYSLLECEKDLREFINLKPLFHDSLRFTI